MKCLVDFPHPVHVVDVSRKKRDMKTNMEIFKQWLCSDRWKNAFDMLACRSGCTVNLHIFTLVYSLCDGEGFGWKLATHNLFEMWWASVSLLTHSVRFVDRRLLFMTCRKDYYDHSGESRSEKKCHHGRKNGNERKFLSDENSSRIHCESVIVVVGA